MKKACLNSNVVIIYREDISSLFSAESISRKLGEYYKTQLTLNVSTVANSVKSITAPEKALHIAINEDKLLVVDFSINESDQPKTDFLTIANMLNESIKESAEIKRYGFNFTIAERNISNERLDKIRMYFFKDDFSLQDRKVKFILPTVGYEKDSYYYTHNYNLKLKDDNTPETLTITVNADHRNSGKPTDTELTNCYQEAYNGIEALG